MAQIKVKDVYLRVRTYDFCSRAVEAERIALALTKLSTDKLAAAEAAYGVFAAAEAPAAPPAAPPSPMVAGMITLVADSSSLEVPHPPQLLSTIVSPEVSIWPRCSATIVSPIVLTHVGAPGGERGGGDVRRPSPLARPPRLLQEEEASTPRHVRCHDIAGV